MSFQSSSIAAREPKWAKDSQTGSVKNAATSRMIPVPFHLSNAREASTQPLYRAARMVNAITTLARLFTPQV